MQAIPEDDVLRRSTSSERRQTIGSAVTPFTNASDSNAGAGARAVTAVTRVGEEGEDGPDTLSNSFLSASFLNASVTIAPPPMLRSLAESHGGVGAGQTALNASLISGTDAETEAFFSQLSHSKAAVHGLRAKMLKYQSRARALAKELQNKVEERAAEKEALQHEHATVIEELEMKLAAARAEASTASTEAAQLQERLNDVTSHLTYIADATAPSLISSSSSSLSFPAASTTATGPAAAVKPTRKGLEPVMRRVAQWIAFVHRIKHMSTDATKKHGILNTNDVEDDAKTGVVDAAGAAAAAAPSTALASSIVNIAEEELVELRSLQHDLDWLLANSHSDDAPSSSLSSSSHIVDDEEGGAAAAVAEARHKEAKLALLRSVRRVAIAGLLRTKRRVGLQYGWRVWAKETIKTRAANEQRELEDVRFRMEREAELRVSKHAELEQTKARGAKAAARQMLSSTLDRQRRTHLRSAFHEWRTVAATASANRRRAVERAITAVRRAALAKGMYMWRAYLHAETIREASEAHEAERAKAELVLQAERQQALEAAAVQREAEEDLRRRVAVQIGGSKSLRALAQAMARWRRHVQEQQEARRAAVACIARHCESGMKQVR